MTFLVLQARMIAAVRLRIRNGETTERGFARRIGVSQPHFHNMMKGTRAISAELSDRILWGLGLSVLDLAGEEAQRGPAEANTSR